MSLKYRPEIDGLRALAIVPVVFFHAGWQSFQGGFVGVDVFFVISGYLITSIIFLEKANGTFSISRFYERRARRILPALYFVMLVVIIWSAFFLSPFSGRAFYRSVTATGLFSSNILFFLEAGNYFDVAAELKPLLHMWSLAIEEQYYVLFPLFVMFVWKLGRRWITCLLACIAITSLIVSQISVNKYPVAAFFLLHTRAWEIAIGALVAVHLNKQNPEDLPATIFSQAAAVFGLFLIVYAIISFDKSTPFPGIYALIPTAGTALIILFATEETFVGKFLSNKLFVSVGLISYSTYLWHQPIFALGRHWTLTELSFSTSLLMVGCSFMLAYLSYRFVEKPFRQKGNISLRVIIILAGTLTLFFSILGVIGHLTVGFQKLKLNSIHSSRKFIYVDHFKELAKLKKFKNERLAEKHNGQKVLVIGDSMAGDFLLAVNSAPETFSKFEFVRGSLGGNCVVNFLHALNGTPMVERTSCLHPNKFNELESLLSKVDQVVLANAWTKKTAAIAFTLAKHIESMGKKVYVIDAFKMFNISDASYYFATSELPISQLNSFMYQRLLPTYWNSRGILLNEASKHPTIKLIDKLSFFCDTKNHTCNFYDDEKNPMLHDDMHVTTAGAVHYRKQLKAMGFFEN